MTICGFVVRGANADFARFRRDIARANEIYRQCGLQISAGSFQEIVNPNWMDHPEWICSMGTPAKAQNMFRAAAARCPASHVMMIYIRSMGGGLFGCGGPRLAGARPAFVATDVAARNTFAHELGHTLFGVGHSADPMNLMYAPTSRITVDPPRLTPAQCRMTESAAAVTLCGPATPPVTPVAPVVPVTLVTPAGPPVRAALLAADEGDFGPVLAAGDGAMSDLSLLLGQDPDLVVRARAAAALGLAGGAAAARALACAARRDGHPVVRLTAAHALGRLGDPTVDADLAALLHDRDPGVRMAGLGALARVATPRALAAVARLAERDPSGHVRALARELRPEA